MHLIFLRWQLVRAEAALLRCAERRAFCKRCSNSFFVGSFLLAGDCVHIYLCCCVEAEAEPAAAYNGPRVAPGEASGAGLACVRLVNCTPTLLGWQAPTWGVDRREASRGPSDRRRCCYASAYVARRPHTRPRAGSSCKNSSAASLPQLLLDLRGCAKVITPTC